ncbi:hypothetical protein ABZ960_20580 [Streptomyces pseudovenezuelae]|uniref:hypothetical protein n=1 Tax=Streptomyces pseudovenezuelae TaxID=67350 RepID=UPI0034A3A5E2
MSEYETHEVETEAGKFYIRILAAERRTYGGGWRGENATEEIKGRVWLSTDPEFKGDAELGHIKIRGRKYTIDHFLQKFPKGQGRLDEGKFEFNWSGETSFGGPYRNEKGQQVNRDAKAYDTLHDLEREALDKFAKDHPDWEKESTLRLFRQTRDNHLSKKRSLELEADQEDIKAALWQKRIDDLTG